MFYSPLIEACSKHPRPVTRIEAAEIYKNMPAEYRENVKEEHFTGFITSANRKSFLWHDYEAGGTDAKRAAPMQCAMIRTDEDLNIIDTPIDWYCKLHGDKLPHPVAVKITGINPMHCLINGIYEDQFFRGIYEQMSFNNTCSTGFNSLSYDDEITRFGLWRNLLPVYDREWANGCSRWDIYPVVAAFCAMHPNDIVWPKTEEGQISLKLELLAKENGITQENAHNALDDVKALIGLARKLKATSPSLWERLYQARVKKYNQAIFQSGKIGWWFHQKAGRETRYALPIVLLRQVPGDANSWLYARVDNMETLRACYYLNSEQIRERLYASNDALAEINVGRPGIGVLKLNKQPQFFPADDPFLSGEWIISEESEVSAKNLLTAQDFVTRLSFAVAPDDFENEEDPTLRLYQDGFPSQSDKVSLSVFLRDQQQESTHFESETLNALKTIILMRKEGGEPWNEYCVKSLTSPIKEGKHQAVNWFNVEDVLKSAELPDVLKKGYCDFLDHLKQKLNLP